MRPSRRFDPNSVLTSSQAQIASLDCLPRSRLEQTLLDIRGEDATHNLRTVRATPIERTKMLSLQKHQSPAAQTEKHHMRRKCQVLAFAFSLMFTLHAHAQTADPIFPKG